jgi:hypothetical protein
VPLDGDESADDDEGSLDGEDKKKTSSSGRKLGGRQE